jgi:hypothetical protein
MVRNAYKNLAGKPEGKILLKRPRRRWEDFTIMDWIHMAQDNETLDSMKGLEFID